MLKILKKLKVKIHSDGLTSLPYAVWDRITLRYYFRLRRQRKEFKKIYSIIGNKKRFEAIYNLKLWGDQGSLSGAGSSLQATAAFRAWLIKNVPRLGISKIVDAPCGDFFWMQHVLKEINVEYHGIDIVEKLVEKNSIQNSEINIKFSTSDICKDPIPDCDLLIVRDFLFHLSFEDIAKFLNNIQNTRYQYLAVTNYSVASDFVNYDIVTGDFRILSLFSHPLKFPDDKVEQRIYEITENGFVREICIFKKEAVPSEVTFVNLN